MTRIVTRLAAALRAHRTDILVLLLLSLLAVVIRLGYLAEYPNSIMHEDSGPYVDEAERLLEGRETETGQMPGRAPGYPLFLAAIISLISPNLLYTIGIQHLLGTGTALVLTLSLRLIGVGRLLSYGFFIAVAFAHRMIHYDNTIGVETLAVFLIATTFLLVTGMVLRRWNPWLCATTIGLFFGYLIIVRSATFFIPFVFALWLILPTAAQFCPNWRRRLALVAIILIPPVSAVVGMVQWNKAHYGRAVLSREAEPAMAFVIAYAGDFSEQGPRYSVLDKYPGMREQLHAIVSKGRATLKDDGYSTVDHYQWPFNIFGALDIGRLENQQEKDRVVAGLFRDTVLSPRTLFEHLKGHTLRELRFMLLDATPVANSTYAPSELVNFTRRDGSVLRIAKASANHEQGVWIAKLVPSVLGEMLQHFTSRYIRNKYTTEYRQRPGMLSVYSTLSIGALAAVVLLFPFSARWQAFSCSTAIRLSLDAGDTAALNTENSLALLAFLIWLSYAFMTCTLVYALHRYSYYVYAFNAFTAFYSLHLLMRYLRYLQARTH